MSGILGRELGSYGADLRPLTLIAQPMNELITTRPLEIQTNNFCRACGCALLPNDNFCGQCGAGCRDLIVPPNAVCSIDDQADQSKAVATTDSAATFQTIVDNRMFVVGMIACAGPLGLLAMWFSQRFTKRTKVITTVSYVLLVIVAPLAVIWYWLDIALRPLVDVLGQ